MTGQPRSAVVDLGSNSVRLVVFEGRGRNPVAIFNEKAVLRLGRGLQDTGRLNPEAVEQALTVMTRYHTIVRAMRADPFEVLGTAAVRDATNGPDFIAALRERMPEVPIRVLSGEQEAALSARGVLCGIPEAEGILADIGGGSLEMVRLTGGAWRQARTLRLGVIRLAERAGGDLARARALAEADLAEVDWLAEGAGQDLYVVGGTWRALARLHMAQTGYPLNMIHHYTVSREEMRELTGMIAAASRRTLERMPGTSRRRLEDLPFAAVVLRRVLRATGARRVVFSADGLREGWYMTHVPAPVAAADPLMEAALDLARSHGRDTVLPPALCAWIAPLFPDHADSWHRVCEAACWMSDIGSHDHPDYRAEQSFLRILRQPGIGVDHAARAFIGLTLALRYDAEPDAPFLALARGLLTPEAVQRATVLGCALRLAYTLSAGTPDLLAATRLRLEADLVLELTLGSGVFAGESITRRLDRLAQALGVAARTEMAA
ncbi:MAG TPA: Ppx/GppA family phosphatase [Acetobacteraceae bacterium]|nr:Ppx/GppA family phosphatase [Acetobacteraceae bacterium]